MWKPSHRSIGLLRHFSSSSGRYTHEEMISVWKRRGFIFQGGEIYGGLANAVDFGPLGTLLKRNLREAWWRDFVTRRPECVGIETGILMPREVWEAAGHIENFTDPLTECRTCHVRFRADHLLENTLGSEKTCDLDARNLDALFHDLVSKRELLCPCEKKSCEFTPIRRFNLLFETKYGCTDESSSIPLRPETAQGMFTHFSNIVTSQRKTLPFGIAQVGKSFRNEISPGNVLFRMREFEQMEMEFFCLPEEAPSWHAYWVQACYDWLIHHGLRKNSVRLHPYSQEDCAHYADACTDIEFNFSFGWGELWGIANRTDFDLRKHSQHSGVDLRYRHGSEDPFYPYCIEPAVGLDRLFLAFLTDAYHREEVSSSKDGTDRVVMRFDPRIAPYQVAILPLVKKQPLIDIARPLFQKLVADVGLSADLDLTQSIGKRYRRQDEIGTPFCITVDFETLEDNQVTLRDRDSMRQVRLPLSVFSSLPSGVEAARKLQSFFS